MTKHQIAIEIDDDQAGQLHRYLPRGVLACRPAQPGPARRLLRRPARRAHRPGDHPALAKQQAIENTRELAEGWIEQARANGQDITAARARGRRDARAAVQPGRCAVTGQPGQAPGVVNLAVRAAGGRGDGGRRCSSTMTAVVSTPASSSRPRTGTAELIR